MAIITLTTDMGLKDHYVAAVKVPFGPNTPRHHRGHQPFDQALR
jgi:hypothetical protein